jgi:hypothetical protein
MTAPTPPIVVLPPLLALTLFACGDSYRPPVFVHHVGGVAVTDPEPALEALLLRRAVRDLGCEALSLEAASVGSLFRATGCGKHALYIEVETPESDWPAASDEPIDVRTDILPLSSVPWDAWVQEGRYEWNVPGWSLLARSALAVNVRGAEMLGCPRADVVPYVFTRRNMEKRARAVGCVRIAEFNEYRVWEEAPVVDDGPDALHDIRWRPVGGGPADAGASE